MTVYHHYSLTVEAFERHWRSHFESLFRHQDEVEPTWLPERVFRISAAPSLYHPQPFFLRSDYSPFEQAASSLGEDEFAVVDREALGKSSGQIGILFRNEGRTETEDRSRFYHIEGQPLEFYLFGRRHDWAFVSSEPFNVGILAATGDASEVFASVYPCSAEGKTKEYVEQTPEEYGFDFAKNYMWSRGD